MLEVADELSLIYRLSDGFLLCQSLGSTGDKFLQGGHYKDPRPAEIAFLGHHQKTPVSWSAEQSSPHLLGAQQWHQGQCECCGGRCC